MSKFSDLTAVYHDFNSSLDRGLLIAADRGNHWFFGDTPSVGDRIAVSDPDATCGWAEMTVTSTEKRPSRSDPESMISVAYVDPSENGAFTHWSDMEPAKPPEGAPDWLVRCYRVMGERFCTKSDLMSWIGDLRHGEKNEVKEDAILDIMDGLVGWCRPGVKFRGWKTYPEMIKHATDCGINK